MFLGFVVTCNALLLQTRFALSYRSFAVIDEDL
jgi:hypothetical protein